MVTDVAAGPPPPGRRVRVRVPASSANLGPAFDAAGLALGVHDEVEMTVATGPGLRVDVAGEAAADVPRDEGHLVVRAAHAAFDRLGLPVPGLTLHCTNRIPHGRGLGSSAAAIVAGVLAARELVPGGAAALPLSGVLDLVGELEGHPDNVAAALLGGFTLAWPAGRERVLEGTGRDDALVVSGRRFGALRLWPAPEVRCVVLVPAAAASTRTARGRLPETVPHADAAVAAGRGALLAAALLVAPAALLPATHDVLHQPYRAGLMPDTAGLVARLREAGLPAVVSGAGPAVLVLTADPAARRAAGESAPAGWRALDLDVVGGATARVVD